MTSKRDKSGPEGDVTNDDRLLPGENPSTRQPDDADHWLAVYTELLQAKAAMLVALNERLASMKEDAARQEIGATDARLLESELARFQKRIDFWRDRKARL
jgi:hypothetical protein